LAQVNPRHSKGLDALSSGALKQRCYVVLLGEGTPESGCDPRNVVVTPKRGKWQTWFCHGECFKQRLADLLSAPGFFDPAHFWNARGLVCYQHHYAIYIQ